MGTGRTLRKESHVRPCKTPAGKARKNAAQRRRLVKFGMDEATVKAITHDLLYTQKTVSEISDELDFPSLSFFGKYFKQHTGLSPRAFRERFGQE